MKKKLMSSALAALAGVGLMAGGAMALPWSEAEVGAKLQNITLAAGYEWNGSDYWRLTDLTSGGNGDSWLTIKKEEAGYESSFGFYTVNDVTNPTLVTKYFEIFGKNEEAGVEKTVAFKETASGWEVSLTGNGDWTQFDDTFGFYYDVYIGGTSDTTVDYTWHTDKQFNKNAAGVKVDDTIEHVVVAYKPTTGTKPGGSVHVFLDDQLYGGDRDWNDMTVVVTDVTPVPEPGVMLLLGTGLGAGLIGVNRRKKK